MWGSACVLTVAVTAHVTMADYLNYVTGYNQWLLCHFFIKKKDVTYLVSAYILLTEAIQRT